MDAATLDGGMSTGLQNAWNEARAWTMQEDRWYNPTTKELCVAELWYRRWVRVPVIKSPDGRVVEFDDNNLAHSVAVASGTVSVMHTMSSVFVAAIGWDRIACSTDKARTRTAISVCAVLWLPRRPNGCAVWLCARHEVSAGCVK